MGSLPLVSGDFQDLLWWAVIGGCAFAVFRSLLVSALGGGSPEDSDL